MTVGFYDVLAVEDPGFHKSEALCLAINDVLDQTEHHDVIRIGALANALLAYLLHAPPQHRSALTDSLLDDIRRHLDEAGYAP